MDLAFGCAESSDEIEMQIQLYKLFCQVIPQNFYISPYDVV